MIIITRYKYQSVIVNGNITITYMGLNEFGEARMGIDAPRDIKILRNDTKIKTRKENDNE